jgi:hypothetical protein
MWILPRLESSPALAQPLHVSQFPFTNHRITLAVFRQTGRVRVVKSCQRWFPVEALTSIALPSPHRRALTQLLKAAGAAPS